jgi:hypothetical protein
MSNDVLAYPLMTEIKLKRANVEGIITCISIRPSKVIYEMQYYTDDCIRKEMWVEEWEFETAKPKERLGFITC